MQTQYKTFKFTKISTNTSTQVLTGAGALRSITINKPGASANTISVYDDVGATSDPIAVINGTGGPVTLQYDVEVVNGIYVVTATGTAADITVSYE